MRKRAPKARRVVFETGPLSVWFYHALTAEGLLACIDARHAKAALEMAANKTDANDADGLAHLAEVGFYREVTPLTPQAIPKPAVGVSSAGPLQRRPLEVAAIPG